MDLVILVKDQFYDLAAQPLVLSLLKLSEFYRITSYFTSTLYFGSEASMLSTFVTFSENCCFLSVLFSLAYNLPLEIFVSLPCASADIGLNTQDAILMDQCMRLADELHDFVP